jgi:hypothetical protein
MDAHVESLHVISRRLWQIWQDAESAMCAASTTGFPDVMAEATAAYDVAIRAYKAAAAEHFQAADKAGYLFCMGCHELSPGGEGWTEVEGRPNCPDCAVEEFKCPGCDTPCEKNAWLKGKVECCKYCGGCKAYLAVEDEGDWGYNDECGDLCPECCARPHCECERPGESTPSGHCIKCVPCECGECDVVGGTCEAQSAKYEEGDHCPICEVLTNTKHDISSNTCCKCLEETFCDGCGKACEDMGCSHDWDSHWVCHKCS